MPANLEHSAVAMHEGGGSRVGSNKLVELKKEKKKKKKKPLGLNIQTHTYLPEGIFYKPDQAGLGLQSNKRNVNNGTASGVCPGNCAI